MFTYKKRLFDGLLRELLEAKGAVVVRGPKWCGKTTTSEQAAKSVLYLDDPLVLIATDSQAVAALSHAYHAEFPTNGSARLFGRTDRKSVV